MGRYVLEKLGPKRMTESRKQNTAIVSCVENPSQNTIFITYDLQSLCYWVAASKFKVLEETN